MKKSLFLTALLPVMGMANDGTGTVGTGGVEYIKNDKIAMVTEDLFISPKEIKVGYQYENLTNQDITENILFPLPKVDGMQDMPFADTKGLIDSFTILSNGKAIKPQVHPRAYMFSANQDKLEDVTEALKSCGLTDEELLSPWTAKLEMDAVDQKVQQCQHEQIQQLGYQNNAYRGWQAEVIYSWQQTFKANEITKIEHSYQPLVGGGLSLEFVLKEKDGPKEMYCISDELEKRLYKAAKKTNGAHDHLGYILKTGANWAKPIRQFNLTVTAPKNQTIAFCWDGKLKKVSDQKITVSEQNFLPKQDLNILFPYLK